MDQTRLSVLDRARQGDDASWRRLVDVYSPLVRGWLIGRGVDRQDAEDLTQDVMTVLVRKLPDFEHSGRLGSFRAWLRTVAVNRTKKFWQAGRCRVGAATGDSVNLQYLDQLADSASDIAKAWDVEHDRHVFRRLLALLETEFEAQTVQVFHRLVIDEASPAEVANETGMTIAAVYGAKSRVLARLRQEAEGLVD